MSFLNKLCEIALSGLKGFLNLDQIYIVIVASLVLAAILLSIVCVKASRRFALLLQLESYQLYGYDQSVERNYDKLVKPLFNLVVSFSVLEMVCSIVPMTEYEPMLIVSLVCFVGIMAAGFVYTKRVNSEKTKKELVLTPRMKRLQRCYIIINFVFCLFSFAAGVGFSLFFEYLILGTGNVAGVGVVLSAVVAYVGATIAYCPLFLVSNVVKVAARLRQKPEERTNNSFIEDAKRIINERDNNLIRIGITGSYGKTSAKFILGSILSEKYNVLVPPSSYNTPLGTTRLIREMLQPDHEVIIAEMGARRVGEIKELCDIVHPQYGLLTSIGNQHLETFGSAENIANTKFELAQSLPEDGIAFFPQDGDKCEELFGIFQGNKHMFGIGDESLYMSAHNIDIGATGSEFDMRCSDGESVHCTTKLLGSHNIMNIIGCAACARAMGMDMQDIANGIAKTEPVEHRLQLIDPGTGILIIDDAFNSNPAGTQAAMDVLSMFTDRRKICITPGMVELGEDEEKENRAFGTRMGGVCDIVILVGKKRSKPIMRGLVDAGFDERMIFRATNLDEATDIFGELSMAGDVVLFENDLPDNYEE